MNATAWFVAGWLCASIFIFLGIWLRARWERAHEGERPYPPECAGASVYSPADLQRAAERRQGLR